MCARRIIISALMALIDHQYRLSMRFIVQKYTLHYDSITPNP